MGNQLTFPKCTYNRICSASESSSSTTSHHHFNLVVKQPSPNQSTL